MSLCIIKECNQTSSSNATGLCHPHGSKWFHHQAHIVVACGKCKLPIWLPRQPICWCWYHSCHDTSLAIVTTRVKHLVDWDKVWKMCSHSKYLTPYPKDSLLKISITLMYVLKLKFVPFDMRKFLFFHYLLVSFQNTFQKKCSRCYREFEQQTYTCSKCSE